MRFSEIERTCKRIIQLRNIKIVSDGEPLVWCQLVDALMDHLEWPIEQWEPNPNDPNGLKDRFDRSRSDILQGYLVLYTDVDKKQKTELRFNVGFNKGACQITIGDTRVDLPDNLLQSEAGRDFLAKASNTIAEAVLHTTRRVALT